MRIVRFGSPGAELPGKLDELGRIRDLSSVISDVDGSCLDPDSLSRLNQISTEDLPLAPSLARIGPCVGAVGKLICVGLNYWDHAFESGMAVPSEPIVFMKATSAICGPNDDIEMPMDSEKVDWEAELGLVIGMKAKYISESDAHHYIAGYCIVNDVSERKFQLEGTGQWTKGKSADTFGPIGPWLVTPDEIPDPQDLRLWLEVNGRRYQDGSTRQMVFSVSHLISYISRFMTLHPGDIISTGTPPGVGLGQKPPIYLRAGDVIRLGINGLGEQCQTVVSCKDC